MSGQGQAVIDFGAFPGSPEASVTVTGQAGILTTSLVDAKISFTAAATADHSVDEHIAEYIRLAATSIVAGTGFTIKGEALSPYVYGQFYCDWVWA